MGFHPSMQQVRALPLALGGTTGTAPSIGAAVVTHTTPAAGVYKAIVYTITGGTAETGQKERNMELRKGANALMSLQSSQNLQEATFDLIQLDGSTSVSVNVGSQAGSTGATYGAVVILIRVG